MKTKKTEKKTTTWADLDRKTRERLAKKHETRARLLRKDAAQYRRHVVRLARSGSDAMAKEHSVCVDQWDRMAVTEEALADLIRRNLGRSR